MATTLLLDRTAWDLVLDVNGNIAVASEPYSQAQDVASEARVFAGEEWYDTTAGIAYSSDVLGALRPVQMLKTALVAAAERVPGVTAATVRFGAISGRSLAGQIQFSTGAGDQVVTL